MIVRTWIEDFVGAGLRSGFELDRMPT